MDDEIKGVREAYAFLTEGIGAASTGNRAPEPELRSDGHNRNMMSRSMESEKNEQRQVKIRAYKKRWNSLKEELYGSKTLAERKKIDLETLKMTLIDVERSYYNLLNSDLLREEEEELSKVKIHEETHEVDKIFQVCKGNVCEALEAKILTEKLEDEARRQRTLNAKDILKGIKIPALRSERDILDWIDIASSILEKIPFGFPDMLICTYLKKSLVKNVDKTNTDKMVTSKAVIEYVKSEYLNNHNITLHIMEKFKEIGDPQSYDEARNNIKVVNRNLEKIESNGLTSFLSKSHLTIMENRTIMKARMHIYLKFVFDRTKDKKQINNDELELELARDPVAESTRNEEAGRGLELDSLNLPGTAALNQTSQLMKGLKEDLKFNISAQ